MHTRSLHEHHDSCAFIPILSILFISVHIYNLSMLVHVQGILSNLAHTIPHDSYLTKCINSHGHTKLKMFKMVKSGKSIASLSIVHILLCPMDVYVHAMLSKAYTIAGLLITLDIAFNQTFVLVPFKILYVIKFN